MLDPFILYISTSIWVLCTPSPDQNLLFLFSSNILTRFYWKKWCEKYKWKNIFRSPKKWKVIYLKFLRWGFSNRTLPIYHTLNQILIDIQAKEMTIKKYLVLGRSHKSWGHRHKVRVCSQLNISVSDHKTLNPLEQNQCQTL